MTVADLLRDVSDGVAWCGDDVVAWREVVVARCGHDGYRAATVRERFPVFYEES